MLDVVIREPLVTIEEIHHEGGPVAAVLRAEDVVLALITATGLRADARLGGPTAGENKGLDGL